MLNSGARGPSHPGNNGMEITLHPGPLGLGLDQNPAERPEPLGLGLDQSMGSEPLLNSRSLRAWVWTKAWVQTQAQRLSVSRERAYSGLR
ncbi:unnamed protein product [Gadus morhua 'NCC']